MKISEIKKQIPLYQEEINQYFDSFVSIYDQYKNSDPSLYYSKMKLFLDNFDRLMSGVDSMFELNKARSANFPYTVYLDRDISDAFLPATKASSIITSIQRILKKLNKEASLNLVDILRGSFILCFDYREDVKLDFDFDRVGLSKHFNEICLLLHESEEEIDKLLPAYISSESVRKSVLKQFKNLTPVPGQEHKIDLFTEYDNSAKAIEMDVEIRTRLNHLVPSTEKSIKVDWENNTATGFLREINNVSKSCILFDSENSSDEENAKLIKLHWKEDSFEKHAYNKYKKKVTVNFSKQKNRYCIESIQ